MPIALPHTEEAVSQSDSGKFKIQEVDDDDTVDHVRSVKTI